jgi:hypothetical protein
MMNAMPALQRLVRRYSFRALLTLAMAALALTAGCQAPAAPEGPTRMFVQVESEDDEARLWDAALDALQDQMFELDRVDRLEGVITTQPETAGSWFEFWRPQSAEPYHWWENNLHTIQETARVRLARGEEVDTWELDVEVKREKYHLEERQIDNAAAALRLYSPSVPTTSGRMAPIAATSYTTDVGRDVDLENKLLNAILLNYQQITPPELADDQPSAEATDDEAQSGG